MLAPQPADDPTVVRGESAAQDASPPRPEGKAFGPYRLFAELGHGGMGVVWKALDTRLDRIVAIKGILTTFRDANAEQVERFLREARASARLRHPNIVSVHEVGEIDGQHFLVCDYIEGESLEARMERGIAVRDAVGLVSRIATALQYAHDQGIVHRDVKPSNILVDRAGSPYVADFGLAKDVRNTEGRALTVTGDVLGTPAYMSPEQASGRSRSIGPASDQFSLGVVLYELLAGRKPFDGESMRELFGAIAEREPVRPSAVRRIVHRDLDTICLKALEKAPERRYARMADLAEDLRRFLDGEPIQARPAGLLKRVARRVARRPLVSALALATIVAATTTGVVSWRGHLRDQAASSEAREAVDRHLRELARSGDALVEAALAWRARGDVARSRTFLEGVEDPVRELIALDPRLAEPWYYRGRMRRALGQEAEAEAAQDRAVVLSRAPDATERSRAVLTRALYERGILRATRYVRTLGARRAELIETRAAGNDPFAPAPPSPDDSEIESAFPDLARLKRQAIDDLRAAAGGTADALRESHIEAGQGFVVTLTEGAEEEAKRHLVRALEIEPYLQEAYTALAQSAAGRGDWEGAASWYQQGHEADLGYFPHVLGLTEMLMTSADQAEQRGLEGADFRRCALDALRDAVARDADCAEAWGRIAAVHHMESEVRAARGEDVEEACRQALLAAERALRADPASGSAANTLGWIRYSEAERLRRGGKDPTQAYATAVEAFRRAQRSDPRHVGAVNNEALVHERVGEWLVGEGNDPRGAFEEAIAGFTKALSRQPGLAEAASNMANVHQSLGKWRAARGEDPSEAWRRAIEGYEKALSIRPGFATAWNNEGNLYLAEGTWLARHGKEPDEAYRKAMEAYDRAISTNPRDARALCNKGHVERAKGDTLARKGKDPKAHYARAIEGYEKGLAINGRLTEAAINLGLAHFGVGNWLRARGSDPGAAYDRALAAYERALAINPGFAEAWNDRGNACQGQAEWLAAHGKDPIEALEKAIASYERARSNNPRFAEAANNEGNAYRTLGEWLVARGQEPTDALAKAIERFERALSINPGLGAAANNEGLANHTLAGWLRTHGKDPSEQEDRAIACCKKALSIDARHSEAANNLGNALLGRGDWRAAHGKDPSEDYAQAKEAYERALAINPAYSGAVSNLATLHLNRGLWRAAHEKDASADYSDALAGFERAMALNPSLWQPAANRGRVLVQLGRLDEGIASFEVALRVRPGQAWVQSLLLSAHYDAARARAKAIAAAGTNSADAARLREEALRHLRQALDLGFSDAKGLAEDPAFAPLRGDTAWEELINRLDRK